jgi:hypothetical protein
MVYYNRAAAKFMLGQNEAACADIKTGSSTRIHSGQERAGTVLQIKSFCIAV